MAVSYTVTDSQKGRQWIAMRSLAFHGPYVLAQVAVSVGGPAPTAQLVADAINRQRVIIDQFPATDPADFAEIALDPTGYWRVRCCCRQTRPRRFRMRDSANAGHCFSKTTRSGRLPCSTRRSWI
ncbi:DUF7373 family lipoprotein [Mycolicibacterium vanbaalenii]|uniref:DUF7373 family lipoprotein n=1 Tax=Mycolicibacterium vanbaalenii TaxID=110539 RepID=UPI0040487C61